jgi:hypothetical protein
MENIYLFRNKTSDQGTEGILVTPGFQCYTLELPWRNNQSNISCIPEGEYKVDLFYSHHFKRHVYHINNVHNRQYVLIHSGNYAGDVTKGYKSHVLGCVLVGKSYGFINKQRAILNSRITLNSFMSFMNNKPFNLKIMGNDNFTEEE